MSTSYHEIDEERPEQRLLREPEYLFIENYIPMFNADKSKVIAMVEIYKEPVDLVARIQRGFKSIWLATLLGGAVIYLGLFWIVRRAAKLLQSQQKQLITNETFVALGEMSSAVAHSLRNPLANIRSSAELAQEIASQNAQKNIGDIINQVDRMSRWVRELLVSLRPMNDDVRNGGPGAGHRRHPECLRRADQTLQCRGAFHPSAPVRRSSANRCCSRKFSIACLPTPWKPCPRAAC